MTKPNTAGSDPIGNKVAEISDTTNTVLKPNSGKANVFNKEVIQASMRRSVTNSNQFVRW